MIKKLRPRDVQAYRKLRLAALSEAPHHFGASARDERKNSDKDYLDGFGVGNPASFVLGKFLGPELVGIIGFRRFTLANLRHKASLWGLYVSPKHRKKGFGADLVKAYLEQAGKIKGLETIQLAVGSGNRDARRLYSGFGFRKFAGEKRGLKVQGEYYDEIWMSVGLREGGRGRRGNKVGAPDNPGRY